MQNNSKTEETHAYTQTQAVIQTRSVFVWSKTVYEEYIHHENINNIHLMMLNVSVGHEENGLCTMFVCLHMYYNTHISASAVKPGEQPEQPPAMPAALPPLPSEQSHSCQVAGHRQRQLCVGNSGTLLPTAQVQHCADSSALLGSHFVVSHTVHPTTLQHTKENC